MRAKLLFLAILMAFLAIPNIMAQKNPYAMTFHVDMDNAIAKGLHDTQIDFIDVVEKSGQYQLTLLADPLGVGTVSGGGAFEAGVETILTAANFAGARFHNWTNQLGQIISYEANFTYTMPPQNTTLTAHFFPYNPVAGIIDDFEEGVNLWWNPEGSGSTIGIIYEDNEGNSLTYKAHETEIVNPWSPGTGSMKLAIVWDETIEWTEPAGTGISHFIRQHMPLSNANTPERQFQPGQLLEVFVYGDGSGSRFRFMARDGNLTLEGSQWFTIDWTGWRRIVWDYNNDENVLGWVNGNGTMDGTNFYFDSFQITRDVDGTVGSNTLYFDDLRFFDPYEAHSLIFNIINSNGSELITIEDYSYAAGETDFTLFSGSYAYSIEREGYMPYTGSFDISADMVIDVTMQETPTVYTLTLAVSPDLAGEVLGAGEYEEGESVSLSAIPAWGYYFLHWTLADQTVVSTEASFTYTMPAEDISLTAHFAPLTAITDLPWLESFEAETFPPLGWQKMAMPGTIREWVSATTQNHTPGGARSAHHSYAPTSAGMQDGWLVTPAIEIPETGLYELSFWSKNAFTSYYHKNSVMISTGSSNPLDEGYVEIWSPETVVNDWVETVLSLEEFAGETIYIAFRYEGIDAHGWYLDDVGIAQIFGPETYTVTFNISLSGMENYFNPDTDLIYITGSCLDWAIPGDLPQDQTLVRIGDSMIWTLNMEMEAGEYEYKYFINEGWTGGEWIGAPNRTIVVDSNLELNDVWGPTTVYQLNLNANTEEAGVVEGAKSFLANANVSVTAHPEENYNFLNWTNEEEEVVSTDANFAFRMPVSNLTLTANFDFVDATDPIQLSDMKLYPNPAHNHFHIQSQVLIIEIIISDMSGKTVSSKSVMDYEATILQQLDPGIYLIRILTSEGAVVKKLQVQ